MITGRYDHIREWQNEVFDDQMKEGLLKSSLFSEIKRFSVFLYNKGIQISDDLLDDYAKIRGFIK